MAQIRLRALKKRYGKDGPFSVDDVTLTIEDGEFVVLLGPSGCGKTTTLRMIAGLEGITGGELWFDDRLMNHEPPDRRNVGMVFQNYALYPHMTVHGNLAFGMQARRTAKAEITRRVDRVAHLLGLHGVLDRRPKELSGGQRQRVALGRALVREPSVFLMDEPLSNLDAKLREQMRLELARLHDELRITTVYVTHDQGEALTLSDRVVVMDGGQVRQVGTPEDVYARPADTFVASFIGSPGMNLWTLPWEREGRAVSLGGAILLPAEFAGALSSIGPSVTVGIRPEHLTVTSGDRDVELRCQCELVEQLGSHTQLHARLLGHGGEGTTTFSARLGPDVAARRGDRVLLGAPRHAVHLFDPQTGERITEVERPSEPIHV